MVNNNDQNKGQNVSKDIGFECPFPDSWTVSNQHLFELAYGPLRGPGLVKRLFKVKVFFQILLNMTKKDFCSQ